ncbi:spr1630 family ClpXP-sensitive toxin [Paenibacillus sp. 22594]|uniref:spr1630 family ClpXP-sensitive toxin n=1 Tax=Paenibacillus sp. 22594 TaxID=3453947 RepID=UPI003F868FFB
MEEYKFNSEHNKMIVDAIVDGYRDYIEHRKDRKSKMKISSAFAWTKGNFIESRLAEDCVNYGFTYKKSKAGLTWDYLQFIHGDSKILFLIKNAAYFNESSFSAAKIPNENSKKGPHRTYLHDLSKINKELKFSSNPQLSTEGKEAERVEQLSFWIVESQVRDELKKFASSYTEFHILTYALDEAYQISEIKHYLPNPVDNIAYLVEDLSDFISGADLTDEDREVVAPEMNEEIMDPAAFDIGILEDEQQQS